MASGANALLSIKLSTFLARGVCMIVFNAAFNSCKPLFFLASTATTGIPKSACNPVISILIPFFAARSFMVSANTTGIFKSII